MDQLTFRELCAADRGELARMLRAAYAPLLAAACWRTQALKWDEFDTEAHDHPDTVGACLFLTEQAGRLVGFMSFDPRRAPSTARIGHNCVLPKHQGKGIGTMQLVEAMRRLSQVHVVQVSTGEQLFFEPSRRMYLSYGFKQVGRHPGGPDPQFGVVEYEYHRPAPAHRLRIPQI